MPVGISDGSVSHEDYTHQECEHGHCFQHSPQWERVGEALFRSSPKLFLGRFFKKFRSYRHCGLNMLRMSKYVTQRCKLCGRQENKILGELVAYCECCGYHFGFDTITARQLIRELLGRHQQEN